MIGSLALVAAGGFLGACARYWISAWMNKRFPSILPRATLAINLSGSFLLGLWAGADWGTSVQLLAGTGFLGAYTTFSTFNAENIQFILKKEWKVLSLYLGTSYVLGIVLAYAGDWIGMALRG